MLCLAEEYKYLVNGEAVKVVEDFMANEEHEFQDYTQVALLLIISMSLKCR